MSNISLKTANALAVKTFEKPLHQLSLQQMTQTAAALNVSVPDLQALRETRVTEQGVQTDDAATRSTTLRANSAVTNPSLNSRNVAAGALGTRLPSTARTTTGVATDHASIARPSQAQLAAWAQQHTPPTAILAPPGGWPKQDSGRGRVDVTAGWLQAPQQLGSAPRVQITVEGQSYILDVNTDGSFGIQATNDVYGDRFGAGRYTGYPQLDGFADAQGRLHITRLEMKAPPPPPTLDWRTLGPARTNAAATHAQIQDWTRHFMVSSFWPEQLSHALAKGALVDSSGKQAPAVNLHAEWTMDGTPGLRLSILEEPLLWDEPMSIKPDGTFDHQGDNFTAKGSVKGDGRVVFDSFAYRGFDGHERTTNPKKEKLEVRLPALSKSWDGNTFEHKVGPSKPPWIETLDRSTSGSFATSVRLSNARHPQPTDRFLEVALTKDQWGNQNVSFSTKDLGALLHPAVELPDTTFTNAMGGGTSFGIHDHKLPNGDRLQIHGYIDVEGMFTLNRLSLQSASGEKLGEMQKGALLVGNKMDWKP